MYSVLALASGKGSTLEFFCRKYKEGKSCFFIQALISNNPKAGALKVAERFSIPFHVLSYDEEWDQRLYDLLSSYKSDLIVLAGFLKKIGSKVLRKYSNQMINSHPSLLPAFGGQGFYGLKAHQAVLSSGVEDTGLSIHLLNEEYDRGRILAQKKFRWGRLKLRRNCRKKSKRLKKIFIFKPFKKY